MVESDLEIKPVDAISVKIRFTHVEAVKHAEQRFSEIKYPIDLSMGEAIRKLDGSVNVEFSLRVATEPKIVVFELRGRAMITGPIELVEELTIPNGESPPTIWRRIYQEAMATIAFLARFFEIPPPPILSTT